MIIIAASLYLPEHIATMWNRAWFYYAGDETGAAGATAVRGNPVRDMSRSDGGGVPDQLGRL